MSFDYIKTENKQTVIEQNPSKKWLVPNFARVKTGTNYVSSMSVQMIDWQGEYYGINCGSVYSDEYHIGLCNQSFMENGKFKYTEAGTEWATLGQTSTYVDVYLPGRYLFIQFVLLGRETLSEYFSNWVLAGVADWNDRSQDVVLIDHSTDAYNLDGSKLHYFDVSHSTLLSGFTFVTMGGVGNAGARVLNMRGIRVT